MTRLILTFLVAVVLSVSLAACASTSAGTAKVKCPACGYTFDAPVTDH